MSTFWRDFAGTMVGGGDYWAHRAFGDNSNMAMRHTLMGPYGYAEQFNTYPFNNRCWGYTPRNDCWGGGSMYDRYLAQQQWRTPYCDFGQRAVWNQSPCYNALPPYWGAYNRWCC